MPAYSGAERLPGLSSEARVWRDAYGVPHIFASSMDDAARALGYLHASERMFQMDILRRVGQGRMAEIRGADLLPVDKFIRTRRLLPRGRDAAFRRFRPGRRSGLRLMPRGSTPFSQATRSRLSSSSPAIGPRPWKPADSLVIGKIEAYQLSQNFKLKLLRARLAAKLGDGTGKLALSRRAARRSGHDPAGDKRHSRKQRSHR